MRIRYAGRMWDVMLEDDGSLDTVVSIQPVGWLRRPDANGFNGERYPSQTERFSVEFAGDLRRPNGEMTMRGLRILGQEAAEAYDAVELT